MKNAYSKKATAGRYDSARGLPPQTMALWMEALKSSIPSHEVEKILDLGCGTGRFTTTLGETFGCRVVGVEPSAAMLDVAKSQNEPNVEWKHGEAESIPLESESVNLVFISQVFHHFSQPERAIQEIGRVLAPAGYLAVRNGTREQHEGTEWLRFFPEAVEIEEGRMPSRQELAESVCGHSFALISRRTIRQRFASSYKEYAEKIAHRGLSSLINISDEAFENGLRRLRGHARLQPHDLPVYEPVDLFVFQKSATVRDDDSKIQPEVKA